MNKALMLKLLNQVRLLRQHEHWPWSQLEAYQSQALHQLRAYTYANSPFYQKLHQGLMDRPLHDLPGLTKEDTLHLPSAYVGNVEVQPLVFNRIMVILPVVGWQVAQQADNGLVVMLAGARDRLSEEWLEDQLARSLEQEGAQVPYIRIQHVAEIPKSVSGKAPLIKAYHEK